VKKYAGRRQTTLKSHGRKSPPNGGKHPLEAFLWRLRHAGEEFLPGIV
jgi:hypothetical protein